MFERLEVFPLPGTWIAFCHSTTNASCSLFMLPRTKRHCTLNKINKSHRLKTEATLNSDAITVDSSVSVVKLRQGRVTMAPCYLCIMKDIGKVSLEETAIDRQINRTNWPRPQTGLRSSHFGPIQTRGMPGQSGTLSGTDGSPAHGRISAEPFCG